MALRQYRGVLFFFCVASSGKNNLCYRRLRRDLSTLRQTMLSTATIILTAILHGVLVEKSAWHEDMYPTPPTGAPAPRMYYPSRKEHTCSNATTLCGRTICWRMSKPWRRLTIHSAILPPSFPNGIKDKRTVAAARLLPKLLLYGACTRFNR